MTAPDKEIATFLEGCVGVVEANSYERHMLWDENRRRDTCRSWESNNQGLMAHVGTLAKMPVWVSLWTTKVDGHKILFIDPTSAVVDHRMIRKWLKKNLPKTAFRQDGYVNKTDAMNFHNVLPRATA
jgi:hypothetical protein